MSECTHDITERECAAADGMCPLCLAADLTDLRQRHAEAVEAAFREGYHVCARSTTNEGSILCDVDTCWDWSEARKGVAHAD